MLKQQVQRWASEKGHISGLSLFPSAEAFRFACPENNPFDILLLDVEMPGMSGLALAKQIRKTDQRAEIVFVTSHAEWIGEGYEVDALHYLVKPVRDEMIEKVLDRAAQRLAQEPPSILISCDGDTIRIPEDAIRYVEASAHYIEIHTDTEIYRVKETFSGFQERLSDRFFKTHRSYLVALPRIRRISRTCVTLDDKTEIPLARGLYDSVNRAFIGYM
ncbi:MAG: LytTR family DNA-binding domain-containing protein [Lachnospiraceae bacterium]|nr:LytTR family DNA-binding domain-containing protein [Lachnospiraceae bacterium]